MENFFISLYKELLTKHLLEYYKETLTNPFFKKGFLRSKWFWEEPQLPRNNKYQVSQCSITTAHRSCIFSSLLCDKVAAGALSSILDSGSPFSKVNMLLKPANNQ